MNTHNYIPGIFTGENMVGQRGCNNFMFFRSVTLDSITYNNPGQKVSVASMMTSAVNPLLSMSKKNLESPTSSPSPTNLEACDRNHMGEPCIAKQGMPVNASS